MKYNIIVDNDKCWGLNIVKNTIDYFENKKLKIDKIWVFQVKYLIKTIPPHRHGILKHLDFMFLSS